MKKSVVIGIIVVLLIAAIWGFIYYRDYYPYSGNAPEITEKELECGAYYGNYNQKKSGTPDDWVHAGEGTRSALWHAPGEFTHPIDCHEEPPLVGGCAGVSLEYFQECCDNWATENEMPMPLCEGAWKIENGECVWKCGVSKNFILIQEQEVSIECGEDNDCMLINKEEDICRCCSSCENVDYHKDYYVAVNNNDYSLKKTLCDCPDELMCAECETMLVLTNGYYEAKCVDNLCAKVKKEEQLIGGCAGVASDQVQECCNNWAEENNYIIPLGGRYFWKIENGECIFESTGEPSIGECAGLWDDSENLQVCCDNWVEKNEIGHVACEGKWVIDEHTDCSWECVIS